MSEQNRICVSSGRLLEPISGVMVQSKIKMVGLKASLVMVATRMKPLIGGPQRERTD